VDQDPSAVLFELFFLCDAGSVMRGNSPFVFRSFLEHQNPVFFFFASLSPC